jgi:hypothetical protein
MTDERIARIEAWLADNAASAYRATGLFDYLDACVQDETDLSVRYVMADRLARLTAALIGEGAE